MPIVLAGAVPFDVDAVAFDKDGTLIDLHATWGPLARAWVHGVTEPDGNRPVVEGLRSALADQLGYDLARGSIVADGVMAAGTLEQIRSTTVDVLTAHGLDGDHLTAAIGRGAAAVAAVGPIEPVPLGDLTMLFGTLHRVGLRCAIVTSDDRSSAIGLVDRFGLGEFVAAIIGGDEAIRPKPAPDPLLLLAERLGVEVPRILMVGDSTTDQGSARAAGCPFVAIGRDTPATLDCDAVIDELDQITVRAPL